MTVQTLSSAQARLFPQTVEAITPEFVQVLTNDIRRMLGIMVEIERMTITITHFDSSLVVNLHETHFIQADLHFHFLHYMMDRHNLMLFDFSHNASDVMYRFYKRP